MRIIPLVVILTSVIGCSPTDDTEAVTQIITVAPQKAPCVGLAPGECLVVDGDLFYDSIAGFTHEDGRSYILEVERRRVCGGRTGRTCPADASPYRYTLERVVSSLGG